MGQAEALIGFAAEVGTLPEGLALAIGKARETAANGAWTPQDAADFWAAYNKLCVAVRPVTFDTLAATIDPPAPPGRSSWLLRPRAAAYNTGRFYVSTLAVFLFLAILCQLLASNTKILRDKADEAVAASRKAVTIVTAALQELGKTDKDIPFAKRSLDLPSWQQVLTIKTTIGEIEAAQNNIASKTEMACSILRISTCTTWSFATQAPLESVADVQNYVDKYYSNVRIFASDIDKITFRLNILFVSVLPLLFGLVGSCAYVVRRVSEQIAQSTFSATWTLRHLVRVALGGLAGAVVGFGWLDSAGLSLSPLALAFIAGYSVEPVFATFDAIAERFKTAK